MTRERNFWSRRREAVRSEAEAEASSAEAQERTEFEESTDEEILTKLDLPNPDSMEAGDDFSKFMARAVPDRIRRRALRKLWLSNPLLANVDGLVDYGEDFTDKAMVVENLQTAYQVGKGMLKHVIEMERQREAKENAAIDVADAAVMADKPEPISLEAEDDDPVQEIELVGEEIETDTPVSEMVDESFQPPRRMQFTFEANTA